MNGYGGEAGDGTDPREENLYQIIESAVLTRQLRAGERLNEQALSEAHGISRTRVHRVLVRLRHANIVRFEHNRGAFICRPTATEAHDLFEVRRYLEECAVRAVCKRIRDGIDADRLLLAAIDDDSGLIDDFSLRLATATGNPVLIRLVGDLLRQCALLQAVYGTQSRPHGAGRAQLIERIKLGDAEGAVGLLHDRLDILVAALDLAGAGEVRDIYARQR